MNFPHDKNKPLFDQLKYEEQKSVSQLNVVLLLKKIHLMLLTCLDVSCVIICRED